MGGGGHDRLHVSLRVNADEQQGMKTEVQKRALHTVKNIGSALRWCSSHQRDADGGCRCEHEHVRQSRFAFSAVSTEPDNKVIR